MLVAGSVQPVYSGPTVCPGLHDLPGQHQNPSPHRVVHQPGKYVMGEGLGEGPIGTENPFVCSEVQRSWEQLSWRGWAWQQGVAVETVPAVATEHVQCRG